MLAELTYNFQNTHHHCATVTSNSNQMKIHSYLAVKILIITIFISFNHCQGKQTADPQRYKIQQWLTQETEPKDAKLQTTPPLLIAGVLCFLTAAISSAGGFEGGSLIIPILTIVAGFDLMTASTFTAFMVTGVSLSSIFCSIFIATPRFKGKMLIDFDITVLSLPIMLLGVSVGGIFNLVLPEWLITILLPFFLVWCIFRTCKSGVAFWVRESEDGGYGEVMNDRKQPLLGGEGKGKFGFPWMKLGILILVWFSFFALYLLHESKYGQNILHIEPCGVRYWLLSLVQIPLAIIFTAWILYSRKEILEDHDPSRKEIEENRDKLSNLMFAVVAVVMGILCGVLGYGSKMLTTLLLLQVGIVPVTIASCSFMVIFTVSMSAIQLLLLGIRHSRDARILTIICFVGLIIGKTVVQRAIREHGRASKIFTSWILYSRKESLENQDPSRQEIQGSRDGPLNWMFPVMALLMGILSGVFGIGGGILISPLLLLVGIAPQVTDATCSFMVLLSTSMSAIQFWLLGTEHIKDALIFNVICFFGSAIGKMVAQRAFQKHGRASIIVYSVCTVMILSTVMITGYGALDIWRDYKSGKYMGFKLHC